MERPYIVTPQAQRDFDNAYWWYEDQYQGLGNEFAQFVDAKIAEIQRNPELFQIIYKERVRRALVLRFPYSVFYVVKPEVLSIFAIQYLPSKGIVEIQICGSLAVRESAA